MTDPFDALYTPVDPVDPDPVFAARLRARLVRALALPQGVDMPRTVLDPTPLPSTEQSPCAGVIPYLAVADARRALTWYVEALGARPRGEPIVMPDGRVGHAELELAGTMVMLSDEHPEIGVTAPAPGEGTAVTLHLEVADVDAASDRAVDAGARLDRPPADNPYGRNAVVVDPFGHRWMISSVSAGAQPPTPSHAFVPGHGDVSYASLWLPDVEVAARFYEAVLGWRYSAGSAPQGRQVEGVSPPMGLWGGQPHPTTFLCFAVDDIAAPSGGCERRGARRASPSRSTAGSWPTASTTRAWPSRSPPWPRPGTMPSRSRRRSRQSGSWRVGLHDHRGG